MYSDAKYYSGYRCMQTHAAKQFFSPIAQKMDWSAEDQDVVMDIGCGSGNSTRDSLQSFFPRVKKVIAIDVLPTMIEFGKKNNAHEKIEYHVANIEDRNSIEEWSGKISKVISIHCFHWVKDQGKAFRHIYHLLKPGGQAAMIFSISSALWESFPALIKNPKWSEYLKNVDSHVPESHLKKHRGPYYKNLLECIGFDVLICEDRTWTHTFSNDDEMRNNFFSVSAFGDHIPHELRDEFSEDLLQGILKLSGRSPDGRPTKYSTTLILLIQKPII